MKTILVPLDYSDDSINALHYAVKIAEEIKAKVVLLHVFEVPVTVTDMPVVLMTLDELEKINNIKMIEIANKIKQNNVIEFEVQSIPGYAVAEIARKIRTIGADLTIMGIRSVSHLTEIFIGSYSTDVTIKANHPVLIVPEKAPFKPINKILFLTDNTEITTNSSINFLKELVKHFNAETAFLHILTKKEHSDLNGLYVSMDYSNLMSDIKFSSHVIEADDIHEGVNKFITEFPADLLVTIPHKHSFFERIRHESNTKKLAFHTPIPMLTLPNIN
jgi:nucleotide-binding universal stress UspA family protein